MFTTEILKEYSFPNIKIYKKILDGNLCGYEIVADDGFVIYDNSNTENEDIYYYKKVFLPKKYKFDNFSYDSIDINSVNSNNVF